MVPAISLASVDLPAPDGPMIAVSEPGEALNDTSLNKRCRQTVNPSKSTLRQPISFSGRRQPASTPQREREA
jgi:hypothetical protein